MRLSRSARLIGIVIALLVLPTGSALAQTAVKLALSGTASQTAGTAQSLTIWALDGTGAAVTSYTGPKSLTFSGATASSNPVTAPTVTDNTGAAIAFGTPTTITFTNGIATVSGAANGRMTLYKAETAVVSVTDGTILTTGVRSTVADGERGGAQQVCAWRWRRRRRAGRPSRARTR